MGQAKQRGTFEERKAAAKPKVKRVGFPRFNNVGLLEGLITLGAIINARRNNLRKK